MGKDQRAVRLISASHHHHENSADDHDNADSRRQLLAASRLYSYGCITQFDPMILGVRQRHEERRNSENQNHNSCQEQSLHSISAPY